MLILPIVNKKRVMNVEVRLKNAEKIRKGVSFDDANESEIIINREKFSLSSFSDLKDAMAPIDFIRSKTLLYPRSFLVTTKENAESKLYDVYEVAPPPKKINDNLDRLYSKAILDMVKEIPGSEKRGRYLSFENIGIDKHLSNDKIATLQRIIRENRDTSMWPRLFQEAGVADLSDTIDFIKNFECTVLSDTSISEDSLEETLKALSNIHTRDYKNLNNYYKMAKSNTDIYTRINYINKILYDKPLSLIRAKKQDAKKLIKKRNEVLEKNAS